MVTRVQGRRGGDALPDEPAAHASGPPGLPVVVLDPDRAYRSTQQPEPVRSTSYVAGALLVRGRHEVTWAALEAAVAHAGFRIEDRDPLGRDVLERAELSTEHRGELEDLWVERVRLAPDPRRSDEVFRPLDTWQLLLGYRSRVGTDPERLADVGLEHPVSRGAQPTPMTQPHPMTDPHPMTQPHPTTQAALDALALYTTSGWGGRQPVSWTGPAPRPSVDPGRRSVPQVVVLDSGIGRHPWLGEEFVTREPEVLGQPIGIPPASRQEERTGVADRFTGELGPDAGHGTFIAGLVRQTCPDAHILGVRLFHADGEVTEAHLLRALQLLALRHLLAIEGSDQDGHRYQPLHVLTMSLGYYHEQPGDGSFDRLFKGPLDLLGRYGVCVVASAGNDATSRPSYPAAFAGQDHSLGDDEERVPVVTVGALNPDGTVALFSNDGPWVRFWRPGVSLVSTLPTTFDGSEEARNVLVDERGRVRSGLDPDDFTSGFAVWSGTSFAVPILAGELAQGLLASMPPDGGVLSWAGAVARARKVVASTSELGRDR